LKPVCRLPAACLPVGRVGRVGRNEKGKTNHQVPILTFPREY
jgi:hypothetical protein